uniref:Ribosome-binding factor A n=1 Tax=Chromera velia CCMP2878 TaxID=1169474 RepID=A0A0G4HLL9_9ALVE|mmetsp:Transcript_15471/g.31401  ORF Transcript_15471/g.31401 Transcript_15471/m.31401 type:complete len:490 (+) Transcript_15471:85-1554(+)|eukprot:Cvel_7364.t1-p1 / transcript=Cvel_7364.t1 / gene=Cvel_7364 / organism=Chromera_velia_CCMP2878 / gene_product=hypothetical protein / transcript_product=hypothetical protein / location=Cvel_scaffold382:67061-73414(+) / protein_length=489 / sequence_SO=supercontig / SO=protein_coding / is_pseudo=false
MRRRFGLRLSTSSGGALLSAKGRVLRVPVLCRNTSRFFSSKGKHRGYVQSLDEKYMEWQIRKMQETAETGGTETGVRGVSAKEKEYFEQTRGAAAGPLFVPPLPRQSRTLGHDRGQFSKNVFGGNSVTDWTTGLPLVEGGEEGNKDGVGESDSGGQFSSLDFDIRMTEGSGEGSEGDPLAALIGKPDRSNLPYQELTHDEGRRLQELVMKRVLLKRRLHWLKMNMLPNPEKEAKMKIRAEDRKLKDAETAAAEAMAPPSEGGPVLPKPFLDTRLDDPKIKRMEDFCRMQTEMSRIRNRIRLEKLESSRRMKESLPKIGGVTLDPIRAHVERRTVRIGKMLQAYLEQILSFGTPEFSQEILGGAKISIHHLRMRTARSDCFVFFSAPSLPARELEALTERLEKWAPRLRFILANRLHLGYTPRLRFVPALENEVMKKKRLFELAQEDAPEVARLSERAYEAERGLEPPEKTNDYFKYLRLTTAPPKGRVI